MGRDTTRFGRQRPGEMIDRGPLTGLTISAEQFRFILEGDGVRVHNVGRAPVRIDGALLPQHHSVHALVGAVIEIVGHAVLIVIRRPRSLPPPSPGLSPLKPFGEPCRMGFTGESPQAHEQREDTLHAAKSGLNTLVVGATGTGKGVVAQAIHDRSSRAAGPFIAANCAQLNHGVTAYELFGGPKNWPNPGTPESAGYFGDARGGTLFLDEIGELPDELQTPLHHALEGSYKRVGESKKRATDCGIVAATNRGEDGLKEDVRMRFKVTIACPSLAERREDIALVLRRLVQLRVRGDSDLAARLLKVDDNGRSYAFVDPSFIVNLLRSPLTGNVRELDRILEMAIPAARDGLPLMWPRRLTGPAPAKLVLRKEPREQTVQELLEGYDRRPVTPTMPPPDFAERPDPSLELVLETLREHDWDFTRTAAALGISVDKLYRLRMKYGIVRPV
jgi:DNA-binding NtrC family response regulator